MDETKAVSQPPGGEWKRVDVEGVDLVGRRLGKYQIQAGIGQGGMGSVYLAYDPMLERRVAIKVLAPHLVWQQGFVERFLREARAAARLKHSGIVTIYDVGQDGNWYYIVMEYLEGRSLSQLIQRRGPLSSKQALPILRQLADALDYAHSFDLVHRDVKPGNVVVSATGQTTLTDFGVVRAAEETGLTRTGALVGTPQYMSPEQALGEKVDFRTDVFSLGIVAYEMLSGRVPYGATTPHAVLHKLIYEPPPSIRSLRPDLPVAVDQVVSKVLAKEPASRYQAAREFVAALEQALAGQARGPRAPAVPAPVSRPRAQPAPKARVAAPPEAVGSRPGGWALWLWWLVASVGGAAVGWIGGMVVAEAVVSVVWDFADWYAAEFAGWLMNWLIFGLVLGITQWLVLRPQVRRAGRWVLATTVGSFVVAALKRLLGPELEMFLFDSFGWYLASESMLGALLFGAFMGSLFEGTTGLILGVFQWPIWRGKVRGAGGWVLISTFAWAMGGVMASMLGWVVGEPMEETPLGFVMPVLISIVPAMITGAGVVWLLSRGKGSARTPSQRMES